MLLKSLLHLRALLLEASHASTVVATLVDVLVVWYFSRGDPGLATFGDTACESRTSFE